MHSASLRSVFSARARHWAPWPPLAGPVMLTVTSAPSGCEADSGTVTSLDMPGTKHGLSTGLLSQALLSGWVSCRPSMTTLWRLSRAAISP